MFVIKFNRLGINITCKTKGEKQMFKKTMLALILLSTITPVLAKGGESNNTQCHGVGNVNSPCNPNTSTGGSNGTNSTNNNTNSVSNSNDIYSISASNAIAENNNTNRADSSAISTTSSNASGTSSVVTNNSISGGGTTINTNIPPVAPPAIAPNMGVAGNNSVSLGVSTIFGGISLGTSNVDSSVRQLNRASADGILVEAMMKVQSCDSKECQAFKKYLLRRFK